jgi:hypothetical protein
MTRPVRPPTSERTLTRYVTAYARRSDVDVARVRRLISFMALAGTPCSVAWFSGRPAAVSRIVTSRVAASRGRRGAHAARWWSAGSV